jgi:hypothetical protein
VKRDWKADAGVEQQVVIREIGHAAGEMGDIEPRDDILNLILRSARMQNAVRFEQPPGDCSERGNQGERRAIAVSLQGIGGGESRR